jgi:hypothetical protein
MARYKKIYLDFGLPAPLYTLLTFGLVIFEVCKIFIFLKYYISVQPFTTFPLHLRLAEYCWVVWLVYGFNLPNKWGAFYILILTLIKSEIQMTKELVIIGSCLSIIILFRTLITNYSFLTINKETNVKSSVELQKPQLPDNEIKID